MLKQSELEFNHVVDSHCSSEQTETATKIKRLEWKEGINQTDNNNNNKRPKPRNTAVSRRNNLAILIWKDFEPCFFWLRSFKSVGCKQKLMSVTACSEREMAPMYLWGPPCKGQGNALQDSAQNTTVRWNTAPTGKQPLLGKNSERNRQRASWGGSYNRSYTTDRLD